MHERLLVRACVGLVICLVAAFGCGKKAKGPAPVDPHSADAIFLRLKEQGRLFQDAYARQDYRYLHDWGYYFNGVIDAFYTKLDDTERQRLKGTLDELTRVSSQLDSASGRGHAGATEATVQRIQALLQELEKEYRQTQARG